MKDTSDEVRNDLTDPKTLPSVLTLLSLSLSLYIYIISYVLPILHTSHISHTLITKVNPFLPVFLKLKAYDITQMMYMPFAIGCAILFGVIWAWIIFNWVWLRPKRLERYLRKQGLRGNSYKLLFGDLKENSLMIKQARSNPINLNDDIVPRLLPFIHKSVAVNGKSSFTWLGPNPRVNIMDPELVKEVLLKHFNYRKPRTNPLFRLLANGLASHEGDQWVKHRKIINPAFHLEKLKLMVPVFCLSSREIISKWEEKVADKGRSCELDVWPYLENLTRDAISRTAFGSNYEEGRRIFQLQKEQAKLLIQAGQSLYVPGLRFLPTKRIQKMKSIDKEVQASLRVIINRRLKAIKVGEKSVDDLLGMMLESNLREIQEHANNKKGGMSIDEVIGECKLFYIAGQETTSGLLLWAMILLSMHQDWQQRAREEVLQVFGNNEPNFDGLNNLKIVSMILHEVLRLYPPIVSLTRSVPEEIKLGEMSIPAGTLIFLPILLIHHSKELWGEDANEFKPERFSEGVSKATKNQASYLPFGWGPRICIGQQFSMIEAKIAVSMILRHFSFELSPSYTHAPVTLINIQPQYGAHLILHKL